MVITRPSPIYVSSVRLSEQGAFRSTCRIYRPYHGSRLPVWASTPSLARTRSINQARPHRIEVESRLGASCLSSVVRYLEFRGKVSRVAARDWCWGADPTEGPAMTEARPLPSYTRADSAYSLFETDHDPAFPAAVDQFEPFPNRRVNGRSRRYPPFPFHRSAWQRRAWFRTSRHLSADSVTCCCLIRSSLLKLPIRPTSPDHKPCRHHRCLGHARAPTRTALRRARAENGPAE